LDILRKLPQGINLAIEMRELGDFYRLQHRYQLSIPILKKAWSLANKLLPKSDPARASYLNSLGIAYHMQADFGNAEKYYSEALKLREQVLGPENESTVVSVSNLAALYYSVRQYSRSEELLKRSIDIRERTGRKTLALVNDLEAYAALLIRTNHVAEALEIQNRSTSIQGFLSGLSGRMDQVSIDQGYACPRSANCQAAESQHRKKD